MSSLASVIHNRRKPYAGLQMEGPLAAWYARSTRDRPDFPITAAKIAERLPAGSAILEVAPGPGYLSIELVKRGIYRVSGLDISHSFVRIASENAQQAGVSIDFRQGDVARMPFADSTFDFIVCQAAFKNFPEPVAALNEIHRVLRPGGNVSIYDLRKDAPADAIEHEIQSMRLPAINAVLMRLIFRFALLRAAYTRTRLESVVARSRFGQGELVNDGVGFELKLAKSATSS
ncbi:MAG TPA: class I SAM-dependent methyltransferase [Ktedonobacterales bacterium]|nr:class I SAM-dependent methyltransferase [Ktedonobacterales bacterium]